MQQVTQAEYSLAIYSKIDKSLERVNSKGDHLRYIFDASGDYIARVKNSNEYYLLIGEPCHA